MVFDHCLTQLPFYQSYFGNSNYINSLLVYFAHTKKGRVVADYFQETQFDFP